MPVTRVLSSSLLLLAVPAFAAADAGTAFFTEKVRPILSDTCFKCHSHEANKSKGGLVVDSLEGLLQGGDTGPAIVPGKPEQSLLIKAIRYQDEDLQMPPNKGDSKKLTDAQIAILTEWVKMGAPWPATSKGQKMTSRPRGGITAEDRKWWAIQPLADPKPPTRNSGWAKTPIDQFIAEKLTSTGLSPAPTAAPERLCRRIYFDLIGLPPTPAEVVEFTEAAKKDLQSAVEQLADKLLSSPRYGERWARHWLDLARFAESDGYRIDEFRQYAWRYRDYVIRAFNTDKPYNRFVEEQLAGDELWPADPDARTATGFLRAGIYEYNNRDVYGQWDTILTETTDVAGDVFLGVGVQCARCHDHKFDPILQKDYFRLRAFFAPLRWSDALDAATPAMRVEYTEKRKVWLEQTKEIRALLEPYEERSRDKAQDFTVTRFPEEVQAAMLKPDGTRTPLEQQVHELAFRQLEYEWARPLNHIKGEERDQYIRLQKQLSAFDSSKPAPLPRITAATDVGSVAPPTKIPKREQLGDIEPGFLTILDEAPAKVTVLPDSTGRRTALAKWITRPDNPLSTRVIVNRVWQYHFGRGLVTNSSDFGKLGEPPSHPELLDWLTRRFIADGWSFKKLHRLIVTSAVYQQAATASVTEKARILDPENKLLWRFPTRRLDAEQVRDAVLAVSGELDLQEGGPSAAWEKPRRSIYTKVLRNSRDPLLDVFDPAEGFQSTAQRNSTTTAMQALTMFNGGWVIGRAKALSARVTKESSADEGERAATAIRLAWNREPSTSEIAAARQFLQAQTSIINSRPAEMKPLALNTEKMPFREGRGVILAPGNVDRLHMRHTPAFPDGDFTIEAFIVLKSLYESGEVRTIASQWDGSKATPGWSFGITGRQSRYKPQTLVLLLNGEGSPAKEAEPVFSGLHLEVGKPYYVAASVKVADLTTSGITFYAKDLSNDDLPMQVGNIAHVTKSGIQNHCDFTLGARGTQKSSVWDGLIDDVRLTRGALPAEALMVNSSQSLSDQTAGFWKFESASGLYKDSSSKGHDIIAKIVQDKPADPKAAALLDFCHVLLNSNEFLYTD